VIGFALLVAFLGLALLLGMSGLLLYIGFAKVGESAWKRPALPLTARTRRYCAGQRNSPRQVDCGTRRLSVDAAGPWAYGALDASPRWLGRLARRLLGGSGETMAYGVVHHFKGGTKEQYEASIAAVHPADGSLPAGQLYHAAGASQDGWTIVAVHDSQASWETFRNSILMPRMQKGIDGGFTAPPEETVFEIVNEVRA
jgi:hypothetical protein